MADCTERCNANFVRTVTRRFGGGSRPKKKESTGPESKFLAAQNENFRLDCLKKIYEFKN